MRREKRRQRNTVMERLFFESDFKKKNGYKRSVELSEIYGLYRQDYCGCVYSKLQREQEKRAKAQEEAEHAAK